MLGGEDVVGKGERGEGATGKASASGFREYDARWVFGEDVDLDGIAEVGCALGVLLKEKAGVGASVVVGRDYRWYSEGVKSALCVGLMGAGVRVADIGLATTPMAYFAQYELGTDGLAMVTASHNENGWTGLKMGVEAGLTFGGEEMGRLRDLVMSGAGRKFTGGGGYTRERGLKERYIGAMTARERFSRGLKVAVECGDGTAAITAPEILRRLGAEVYPLGEHNMDWRFPRFNPNPEDVKMLEALGELTKSSGAGMGFAFDGDGDRCGFADGGGRPVFADKVGVLAARSMSREVGGGLFLADIKSTALYMTDKELSASGGVARYWRTGHSHMKRGMRETEATAGFERSGHFYLPPPWGRGYDDGISAAILACDLLCEAGVERLEDLTSSLAETWQSPTWSPYCADEEKYGVVEKATKMLREKKEGGGSVGGRKLLEVMEVNGARFVLDDGSWGLVRASSNKPCLTVCAESVSSREDLGLLVRFTDDLLKEFSEVGDRDWSDY